MRWNDKSEIQVSMKEFQTFLEMLVERWIIEKVMINIIRSQVYLMTKKKIFWCMFYVVLLLVLLSYIVTISRFIGMDMNSVERAPSVFILNNDSEHVWGKDYLKLIFPVVITCAFVLTGYEERNNGSDRLIVSRCGNKNYMIGKVIACFISAFIILFIPLLINLILCAVTFSNNTKTSYGIIYGEEFCYNVGLERFICKDADYSYFGNYGLPCINLFIKHPYIYNFVAIIGYCCFGGVLAVFAYSCTLWVKKYKVLILLPAYMFMYIMSNINNMLLIDKTELDLYKYVTIGISASRKIWVAVLWVVVMFIFVIGMVYKKLQEDII